MEKNFRFDMIHWILSHHSLQSFDVIQLDRWMYFYFVHVECHILEFYTTISHETERVFTVYQSHFNVHPIQHQSILKALIQIRSKPLFCCLRSSSAPLGSLCFARYDHPCDLQYLCSASSLSGRIIWRQVHNSKGFPSKLDRDRCSGKFVTKPLFKLTSIDRLTGPTSALSPDTVPSVARVCDKSAPPVWTIWAVTCK